jgi:hypothetical protein
LLRTEKVIKIRDIRIRPFFFIVDAHSRQCPYRCAPFTIAIAAKQLAKLAAKTIIAYRLRKNFFGLFKNVHVNRRKVISGKL